ncbi:hypothetical protein ACWEWP_10260 [Streptomyces olivaceus]
MAFGHPFVAPSVTERVLLGTIADIILRTEDETDVDNVFVDFVHLADQGVDQALELLSR